MEREIIKLNNSQWRGVVWEDYLEIDGEEIEIREVEKNYENSGRHTEHHNKIFMRVSDNKYFKVGYETSVKDEMGWRECNWGDTEAIEVFPKEITIIIYE